MRMNAEDLDIVDLSGYCICPRGILWADAVDNAGNLSNHNAANFEPKKSDPAVGSPSIYYHNYPASEE